MFIVGITGKSGAGKTSALRALESLGALLIDCDELYHKLLLENNEMKLELSENFNGVVSGGVLDRKKLGGIVFNDPSALLRLNDITHKYVTREIDARLDAWSKSGGKLAAVDAIALIESGRASRCDIVVGITAPEETRIERIIQRDGVTREQALSRVSAQKPDSFFEKNCEFLLENAYNTAEEFENVCKSFFERVINERMGDKYAG